MSKKIIIIIIIILVLAAGGIWFYLRQTGKIPGEPISISNLFPSSGENNINLPSGNNNSTGGNGLPTGGGTSQNIFLQLTTDSVSGAAWSSTTVKYIEQATGNIYEILPDGQNKKRITNTTILKTFDASWSKDANKLILKYFDNTDSAYPSIKNFMATIKNSTTTELGSLSGIFLPNGSKEALISPFEDKIFYFTGSNNITNGVIAGLDNKKQANIFSSSFGEFLVDWPVKNTITLLTKPSAMAEGFFYTLDAKTGKLTKILGNLYGLTALLSPDGQKVFYSYFNNGSLASKIFDVKNKTDQSLDITTLADKCVWSLLNKNIIYCAVPQNFPSANYPDDWYMGIVFFNDNIWQKDLSTGETKVLVENTNTDAINLFLSASENYLFFTNKKDNTLWSVKLK